MTDCSVNVSRSCSISAISGRSPRSTPPATVARVCASAPASAACRVRRAAVSTTQLTATATTTKIARASRLSVPAMVSRPYGGVKNQFRARNPETAASSAGQSPPISATPTTATRNSRMSAVSDSPESMVRSAVSTGSPASTATKPARRRRRDRAAGGRRAPRPRPARSCGTRCTSMAPDSAVVVTPTPAEKSWATRPRLEAPSTIWVALTARAKSSSARGTSAPTTWWYEPPRLSTSTRWRDSRAGSAPTRPSLRATCTASSAAPRLRSAIRAARRIRVSPSGPPVRATTTRSRVSHVASMPWSVRYAPSWASTLSASQSSASSRRAVRFPVRK